MDSRNDNHSNKSTPVEIIGLIVAILALGVSIWSLFSSQQTSKELVEYQVSEERLPIVTGLNCEIPIQLEKAANNIILSNNFSEELYPLQIALYNIGPGIAQNCKAEWEECSIQDACAQMIDLLRYNSTVKIKEFSYKQSEQSSWYLYDYIVNIEDENDIVKLMYWDGTTYVTEDFSLQTARLPYLQSLSVDYSPFNISLPRGFSLLLFEMFKQEITASISIKLCISYQNVVGETFVQNYDVTFLPTIESNIDDCVNGYFYISFQATNAISVQK